MVSNKFVETLFEKKIVQDEALNDIPLHSGVSEKDGEFLQKIILENKFKNTLEIGCAFGISSLYICAASSQNEDYSHTIIDAFQTDWKNIGVLNLKRAGFTSFELIENLSEIALPQLLDKNKKYDFAFIDGWHTFDHVMIDFFYINRMLEVGGVITFHDLDMPSQKKLFRYILNYPCYEFLDSVNDIPTSKTLNVRIKEAFFVLPLKLLSTIVPKRIRYELFSGEILKSNEKLGLDGTVLAIKKTKEDDRDWRWFEDF
ncbi:class I SAM-dependent methyltransferase [Flavobacterium sp.]|uniref:class I SAM-dependent methyltransferase n=1 Tax=Flavobacterium sp. TaxID=239 RepID=UPI0025CC6E51|nr:class I SAM-dependent methyltransferase [Flavobacterium sp.]